MKRLKFEPSDFFDCDSLYARMAILAQAKHDAFMKELIESSMDLYASGADSYHWTHRKDVRDTHHGLLINVKEIQKKCDCHEPNILNQKIGGWFCKHCGVELVANWAAK